MTRVESKLNKLFQRIKVKVLSHDLLLALCIAIILIFVGVSAGRYNNLVVPVTTNPIARYTGEASNPLSFMVNWDGADYLSIAQYGYSTKNLTNFFPLYPALISLVNKVVGSFVYSGLAVSWIFLVGALYFYIKVLKYLFKIKDNIDIIKGLLLFIFFPTAVFLLAAYTESLFAFLALGAIYYSLKSSYLKAAVFTLFATATHDNGVFILLLVALILFEQRVKLTKILTSLVMGSLGLVSYMIFLLVKFHKPLSFISAQQKHGWLAGNYFSSLYQSIDLINVVFIILLVASIYYWWSRRKSFAVYSFLFLLIPLLGGIFGGFNRYVLMAVPIQFMLFEKFHTRVLSYTLLIILFCIGWSYFLFQYAGGYVGG